MIGWPAISWEVLPWEIDPNLMAAIPRSRRRRIAPTYEAAVPSRIAGLEPALPPVLLERLGEVLADLSRFDEQQAARGFDLPALLLRSESSASSQIEHLTSSVRNVALAELLEATPQNARLIAGNVAAMREALSLGDGVSRAGIRAIHATLMANSDIEGGVERDEQVWVGGSGYSPHGALFVPPAPERVSELLDDLVGFARSSHSNPIAKAAIAHAQFETIHPFIDGNGRTGRTLLHVLLRCDGVLGQTTLPVSAGLLHRVDDYMDALRAYQDGNPIVIVEQVANALEIAMSIGQLVARRVEAVLEEWRLSITERKGARIHLLPGLLVEQPVVTAQYIAGRLGVTARAASDIVARAREYGILHPVGSGIRSTYYQASDIIEILEDASDIRAIRRMLAQHR